MDFTFDSMTFVLVVILRSFVNVLCRRIFHFRSSNGLNNFRKCYFWLIFVHFFRFQVTDVMCNFEFHDCFFFQPSFTGIRFRRMTFAAVYTFRRVFTLTSVMSVAIRSTVLTYRSGVFSTVIFMMSEPLAVKTAQKVRYVYINRNDTIENF